MSRPDVVYQSGDVRLRHVLTDRETFYNHDRMVNDVAWVTYLRGIDNPKLQIRCRADEAEAMIVRTREAA